MTFEELQAVLKEKTGDRSRWTHYLNPGKKIGGWIRDDVKIDPGVIIDPEAVIFGPGTHLRAGTQILGASMVGPHVETRGEVLIEAARVWGDFGLRGWLKRGQTYLEDSTVSHAKVHASRLSDATVSDGARVFHSVIKEGVKVAGKNTVVDGSSLSDRSEVLAGACVYDSKLSHKTRVIGDRASLERVEASGALIDKPGHYVEEKITDNRYSTLDSLNYRWVVERKDKEAWTSSVVPAAFPDPYLHGATLVTYHPSRLVPGPQAMQTYVESLPTGKGGFLEPARKLPPASPFQRPAKCIYADGMIGEVTGHEGHHHGLGGHDHGHAH